MAFIAGVLDRYLFWRNRRQWWSQFWYHHIVHGVSLCVSMLAFSIVVAAPSTAFDFAVWGAVIWVLGELFYQARRFKEFLPRFFYILNNTRMVRIQALGGVLLTGALMAAVFPNPDYLRAFHMDILWSFFLVPLIFNIRHGGGEWLFRLVFLSCSIVVLVPVLVLGVSASTLSSGIASAVLLVMLVAGAYGTQQTLAEKAQRVNRQNNIIAQISNRLELKTRYDQIARAICHELRYPVIHIMAWDPLQNALVIQGAEGRPRKYWKSVRVKTGEGITGYAFQSGKTLVCNDVHGRAGEKYGYVQPEGYEDINAELVVPLIYGRERLGVLDFQSTRRDEFNDDDVAEAKLLAKSVALAMKWNETTHAQLLLWKTISLAQHTRDVDAFIDEILETVRKNLGASVITFYSLIPETNLPRQAHPYRNGRLLVDESAKGGPDSFLAGLALPNLIHRWQVYFSPDALNDPILRGEVMRPGDFISREHIRSVIFLPLGEADYRLGVLFINYREDREFTAATEAQIRAFGAALTLAIRRLHEREQLEDSLRIGVHRNLARYFYRIKTQMTSVAEMVESLQEPVLEDKLRSLEDAIGQLRGRALRDTRGIFDLLPTGLEEAVLNAFGSLDSQQRTDFNIRVDPEAERLSRRLHAVLYNLVVEAISNALTHGHATRIYVDVSLSPARDRVECCVTDDGCGFNPNQVRPGSNGIFVISDWIKRELNGQGRFLPREDGGMRVHVSIPILVPTEDEDET